MPNFLKSSALLIVSIALSFLTIELYVRTFVDDGLNYELEMWKYAKLMKQVSDDPNIGHEHRPNTDAHLMGVDVATNSAKLRDREFTQHKPASSIRILMLGLIPSRLGGGMKHPILSQNSWKTNVKPAFRSKASR